MKTKNIFYVLVVTLIGAFNFNTAQAGDLLDNTPIVRATATVSLAKNSIILEGAATTQASATIDSSLQSANTQNAACVPGGGNPDFDNDGIADRCDNCPSVANITQTDTNQNGIGDSCESQEAATQQNNTPTPSPQTAANKISAATSPILVASNTPVKSSMEANTGLSSNLNNNNTKVASSTNPLSPKLQETNSKILDQNTSKTPDKIKDNNNSTSASNIEQLDPSSSVISSGSQSSGTKLDSSAAREKEADISQIDTTATDTNTNEDSTDETSTDSEDTDTSSTTVTPLNDSTDSSSSKKAACGDGQVEGIEECDDGNTTNGDGCSSKCRTETSDEETDVASCSDGSERVSSTCFNTAKGVVCIGEDGSLVDRIRAGSKAVITTRQNGNLIVADNRSVREIGRTEKILVSNKASPTQAIVLGKSGKIYLAQSDGIYKKAGPTKEMVVDGVDTHNLAIDKKDNLYFNKECLIFTAQVDEGTPELLVNLSSSDSPRKASDALESAEANEEDSSCEKITGLLVHDNDLLVAQANTITALGLAEKAKTTLLSLDDSEKIISLQSYDGSLYLFTIDGMIYQTDFEGSTPQKIGHVTLDDASRHVTNARLCKTTATDESDSCTPAGLKSATADTQSCYTGTDGTKGVGACQAGTQTCTATTSDAGEWGDCEGEITPETETCGDKIDNDCDGQTDEGCECNDGETQECYSGDSETAGVGSCVKGVQTCSNNQWGDCEGEITPETETCGNDIDEDCNGSDKLCDTALVDSTTSVEDGSSSGSKASGGQKFSGAACSLSQADAFPQQKMNMFFSLMGLTSLILIRTRKKLGRSEK